MGERIAEANLTDWRKLCQGLHGRYLVEDLGTGARFVAAVSEAGDAGAEHVVAWVTQQDVDLARRITEIAADHQVDADPASVSVIELGLDTAPSATIAPVRAALLTGNAEPKATGPPATRSGTPRGRVPNLWFGDADEHETPGQRFHIEVHVAPEVAEHGRRGA